MQCLEQNKAIEEQKKKIEAQNEKWMIDVKSNVDKSFYFQLKKLY